MESGVPEDAGVDLRELAEHMAELEQQHRAAFRPMNPSPAAREWLTDHLTCLALHTESLHALARGDMETAEDLLQRAKQYDARADGGFERYVTVKPKDE